MEKEQELKLADDAWFVQNACNPIAVANLLFKTTKALTDEGGTDYATAHPITKIIIGKLCALSNIDHESQIYGDFLDKYPQFIGK